MSHQSHLSEHDSSGAAIVGECKVRSTPDGHATAGLTHLKYLQSGLVDPLCRMSASEESNVGNFGSETNNLYGVIDKHK
jgi:hypothetical protein